MEAAVLRLNDDVEAFRQALRVAAEQRIAPLAADIDRTQEFSTELWAELRALDVFGLAFDDEVGGAGGGFTTFVVAIEELARAAGIAAYYLGTTVQVARVLLGHAVPEMRDRWVPRLVTGEACAAWAFTEPQTGSDPRQIQTNAERDGEGWRLNGTKAFISFAAEADLAVVFARTADDMLAGFLIDTADPGWQPGRHLELMAFGGAGTAPVVIDDIHVGRDALLGTVGTGFDVMLAGEAEAKVRAAALCVGIAQRAVDEAASYAIARTHRGVPIGEKFPTVAALLGQMEADVLTARALVRSVADLVQAGRSVPSEAAAARITAGRVSREVTSSALQICGAYGLTREMVVERLYREGKFYEVAMGVTEIQRAIVAREVLKRR